MAHFDNSVRRLLLACGFAIAVAAAPAIAAVAVPTLGPSSVQACGSGEEEDVFTGECVPHTVPNSPEVPTNASAGLDNVPSVDGVACEGRNDAQCRGLAEEQQGGPVVPPSSSVDGQPVG
jgi:hypothetical protein